MQLNKFLLYKNRKIEGWREEEEEEKIDFNINIDEKNIFNENLLCKMLSGKIVTFVEDN